MVIFSLWLNNCKAFINSWTGIHSLLAAMHTHHINLPDCGRDWEIFVQGLIWKINSFYITHHGWSLFSFVNFIHEKHKLGSWWCCRAGSWQPLPPVHTGEVGETQGWEDPAQTRWALPSMVLWKFLVLSSLRKKGLVVCEAQEGGNHLRGPTSIVKALWQLKQCCLSVTAFPSLVEWGRCPKCNLSEIRIV